MKRFVTLIHFNNYGMFFAITRASTLSARLEVEASFDGEAAIVAAVEEYRYSVDGPVYKAMDVKYDFFRGGLIAGPLLLRYGALRTYRTWHTETASAYQMMGLAESRQYASEASEIEHLAFSGYFVVGLACGYKADVKCLLDAVGLSDWQGEGYELYWHSLVEGRWNAV